MKTITKIMWTETGHRLTNYAGKCAHLHGHSYKWEVTVGAEQLDKTGFIIDYSDLKQIMKNIIGPLDHAFLFHDEDPLFYLLSDFSADPDEILRATNGDLGRYFTLPFNPTTENILNWIVPKLQTECGVKNIILKRVRLHETATSFGEWEFKD